jgi:ribosomal protein L37AE/L43A
MECAKCGASVMNKPLMRINPIGEAGIWWCEDCVRKNEPELYKNQIEDEPPVLKDLKKICYK